MNIGGRTLFIQMGINYLGLIWKNNMISPNSMLVTTGLTLIYAGNGLHEDMQSSQLGGDFG